MGTYVFIVIVLAVLFVFIRRKNQEERIAGNIITPVVPPHIPEYRKKSSVMNGSESAFFFELQKQLPEGHYVFPKMRIADMLDPIHGKGFYNRRNKVLPKHIDFLVCNKYFQPVVAIEVNGKSHLRQDRIERDELVKQIFKDANIPLEFVNVGVSFSDSIGKIKELTQHS